VTPLRSPPNGRNAEASTVHHSGLKASGENVLLHAVKMEHESVKFIVKSLKLMGELMTIVYCISFNVAKGWENSFHNRILPLICSAPFILSL
jgi:hypothetical protein